MAGDTSKKSEKNSRKAAFREQRQKAQKREKIVIFSVVAVLGILLAAVLIIPNLPVNPDNVQKAGTLERSQVDGTYAGDPNAPITVTEFSDFNCVHCSEFFKDGEDTLVSNYINTGKVYFRYVPMSFISQTSFTAAEAAYCAADQSKFWEYHDVLFTNYGADFNDSMLQAIAQQVGLNMDNFNSCYTSGKYAQQVQDDLQYAQDQGVTGTPTFQVNGQLVDRYSLFSVIDQELAK